MARPAGGECWEGEDGQCDSGIESLRSLPGGRDNPAPADTPTLTEPPTTAGEAPTDGGESSATCEPPTPSEERLDSSYGSGALPEALPTAEPPPDGSNRRRLEALTYVSEDGDTLVHLAIIHCVPDVALCFIAQLPRELLEIQNDLFQTPLHLAVYLEQPSVVQALIHKGVNPGLQDRNGNTPLHLACEQQRLCCAQQLLRGTAEPPGHLQDLQLQNWQGLACLHISTLKGNIQMMSLLLQSGANIDVQEGTSGKTPLHMAVECHNRSAVQFLLHNGAYVDAQMYNGCTPLHLAVGRKDAAIAAILSHSGADTLLRNMEDETAQDLADGNDDLLALLPFDDLKISGKPVVCSE
ncbi:hypothetical protein ASZ78_005035 [Callipepla squamata]|uniref:Uncharacterized protein n=1 Tax=Callipepla squamata TaxID=9009 RepID=A0A226NCZ5_CALSU|nr:hypothetical protein ASZ78_005035 [Callipepla squamata]